MNPGTRPESKGSSSRLIIALLFLLSALNSGCSDPDSSQTEEETTSVDLNLYTPENLPSNFSPPVPDSLQPDAPEQTDTGISLGLETGRRGALDDVGESTSYTANGYIQLQSIIDNMRVRKRDVALNFVMADAIYPELIAACAEQDTDSGCSIPAGELHLTFTEEMMNFVLESQGIPQDGPGYAESAANYAEVIGTPLDIPQLLYTTHASGYEHQLVVDTAFWQRTSGITTLRWKSDRSRVAITFEYGSAEAGAGSEVYNYDESEKLLVYSDRWTSGESSSTNEATLKADPARLDTRGVIYTARNDQLDPTNEFLLQMQGVADDNGGIVESLWSASYPMMGLSAGLDLLSPDGFYLMASVALGGCETVTVTNGFNALGEISTYDANHDGILSENEVGPTLWSTVDNLTDPTSYVFCLADPGTFEVMGQAAEPGQIVYAQTGIITHQYGFLEGFTGNGSLTYSGFAICGDGTCGEYGFDLGSAEIVAADPYSSYFEDLAPGGSGLHLIPAVELDGTPSDPSYTIYFTRDGTPVSFGEQSNVIGYAWFDQPSQTWQLSWFGTSDEVATADGYYYYYDDAQSQWVFVLESEVGIALQD